MSDGNGYREKEGGKEQGNVFATLDVHFVDGRYQAEESAVLKVNAIFHNREEDNSLQDKYRDSYQHSVRDKTAVASARNSLQFYPIGVASTHEGSFCHSL